MTCSLFLSSAASEVRPPLRKRLEAWVEAARQGGREALYRASLADTSSAAWVAAHPEWEATAVPRFRQLDLRAVQHLCDAFLDMPWTAELGRIQVPTLVVVGEEDSLKPLDP